MMDNSGYRGGSKIRGNTNDSSRLNNYQYDGHQFQDTNKATMINSPVFIPNPASGFIGGRVTDLGSSTVTVSVQDPKSRKVTTVEVPYEQVLPAEDDGKGSYEDNCSLMYLNEATLLENVRRRWDGKGEIYTYTASMLIALNPYRSIPALYSPQEITRYQGRSLGTLPPHIYAIADKAYRDMRTTKSSQSVIVSGESGAGKTETTKYILKFLCNSTENERIEKRILDANPLLESFGNAKTTRNNNSSRFGKFIEIHFDSKMSVAGGYISHYLLEKSRIPHQSSSERNYHIFYQLLSSLQTLDSNLRQRLGLTSDLKKYRYLASGSCQFFNDKELKDPIVHDERSFKGLLSALDNLQMKEYTNEILAVIALILHIGNIDLVDDDDGSGGGCTISQGEALERVVALGNFDKEELIRALTNRTMQTGQQVIQVPLKKKEATHARDAMAKSIYSRLFDLIVSKINEAIPFSESRTYIGVLDIAGFEYFTVNSFEQFCINYCNEKLQQFFNERALKDEQDLYEREGLSYKKIEFADNLDCIELIEGKPGILSLVDEEAKLPKPSPLHFTEEVHSKFGSHFRLGLPRQSRVKEHRGVADNEGFVIRHFAGAVAYSTKEFLDKNNDALHFSLEVLLQNCGNSFLKGLYKDKEVSYKGKLTFVSVAGKFKTQLNELLDKLRSTGTSFVRCVKPNSRMIAGEFEGGLVLNQLQCAGMTSVLELMQKGFPSRVQFSVLYEKYKDLLPKDLARLDPRFFCRALFRAVGLRSEDYAFGLTKVFFRPGKFKEFDTLMRSDPQELIKLVSKVKHWIVVSKWKRVIYTVLSAVKILARMAYRKRALITIQSGFRGALARRQHKPRIQTLQKLRKLEARTLEAERSAGKLKDAKRKGQCALQIEQVKKSIGEGGRKIKASQQAPLNEIYESLLRSTDTLMRSVQDLIRQENEEEARKLREAMEAEERRKAEELKKIKEEEERVRQRAELEARRKAEEARILEMEAKAAKMNKPPAPEEDRKGSSIFLEEQEKRDTEMAWRLASEGNTVEFNNELPIMRKNEVLGKLKGAKHDLSGWKYSELRDTINTSCDVELLNACREEFHRRLKVYHAWKAKHSAKSSKAAPTSTSRALAPAESSFRGPQSIYEYQQRHNTSNGGAGIIGIIETPPNQQRYFRVPYKKEGVDRLWFAHFEGEYIKRQMEVGGGEGGKCFVAGRDDMQMCELKLSETGLTRKRGAEILEYEFEKEWSKWNREM